MELLLLIAIILLAALAVEFFLWPEVFKRPPWEEGSRSSSAGSSYHCSSWHSWFTARPIPQRSRLP
jgi:hypothetical protein